MVLTCTSCTFKGTSVRARLECLFVLLYIQPDETRWGEGMGLYICFLSYRGKWGIRVKARRAV